MAINTGDIVPFASGAASIGVEQNGACNMTDEIVPFCHVHMNSGVFHNPLHGNSGVIRYGAGAVGALYGGFDFSTDGGTEYRLTLDHIADTMLVDGGPRLHSEDVLHIQSSGFNVSANGQNGLICEISQGPLVFRAGQTTRFDSVLLTQLNSEANVLINAEVDANFNAGVNSAGLGGQMRLRPFKASGQLEYRFGPHQSWYMKTTHSSTSGPFGDGFNPLVPSGQIIQMILENAVSAQSGVLGVNGISVEQIDGNFIIDGSALSGVSLQDAYNNGNRITTSSSNDIEIVSSDTSTLRFIPTANNASFNMSGVLEAMNTNARVGDLTHVLHGMVSTDAGVTSEAEAQAQALGLSTLAYNSGSGVIGVANVSGVQTFRNSSVQGPIATTPSFTRINLSTEVLQQDRYFAWDSSVTGIRVLADGLYSFDGQSLSLGTGGGIKSYINRLTVNGGSTALVGTQNAAFMIDTFGGVSFSRAINLQAGDYISVEVSMSTAAGGQSIFVAGSQSSCTVKYLGEPRGGFRQ